MDSKPIEAMAGILTRPPIESSKPASLKEAHLSHKSAETDTGTGSETPPSITPDTQKEAAEFKPSTRLYVAFLTLAVITLMVALDGTSLSVALPVGSTRPLSFLKKSVI